MNDLRRDLKAEIALSNLPPSIVSELLNDEAFVNEWQIQITTKITIGNNGPVFERDQLLGGLRKSLNGLEVDQIVVDTNGESWSVVANAVDGDVRFLLSGATARYRLKSYAALAADPEIRLKWFAATCAEMNINGDAAEFWNDRLAEPDPLGDEEFGKLVGELALMPTGVYQGLNDSLMEGTADLSNLIPCDPRYYERLIGEITEFTTLDEYVDEASRMIATWQAWKPEKGFRFALSLCSLGAISKTVQLPDVGEEMLAEIFSKIASDDDPLSKVAAVEIALAHCDTQPVLASFVEAVVGAFIADDPHRDESEFALLSQMAVLTASELSRKKAFPRSQPYYRKQASLAQASVILRAFSGTPVDRAAVVQWADRLGSSHDFYLQGLVDLRVEPRWLPDFIHAEQIRADFIGRIRNAVATNDDRITCDRLRALLVGPDSPLAKAVDWPFASLPSPLEGSLTPQGRVPEYILDQVRASLEAETLTASSFAGLVNVSLVDVLPSELSELAAAALRRVKFSIENLDDDARVFSLISGLAIVAAVSRSSELADTLRILTRILRRRKRFKPSANDEVRVAVIAAASRSDIAQWSSFCGEWLTEVAFEISDKAEALTLLAILRRLQEIETALIGPLGKAIAALEAYTS
ncbi:hypothetical protein ACQZ6H_19815 [Agrobacterium fabrum]|uniref:hypothetical protein n=1 Tax=Agrobacterium fabrum TaxID=1176649 RepID=UPI0015739C38|nr:hypothetical protein [Agrobacterium fabrum]WIE30870.1 hypothetical protein G6L42_022855 [Agrobacterium fabrum]WIE46817.1 hypothetical protein G6L76_022800 [Agrobacterium fabrum]